jgi:putative phosphoribosyl transferase
MELPTLQKTFESREEAGLLLAKKLSGLRSAQTVVVGIPRGGVCVALSIARELSLPLEVMPCKTIHHPANAKEYIGSVCATGAFIHEEAYRVPQDYIAHQIASLQHTLQREQQLYYADTKLPSLHYKIVILVDDIVATDDSVIACVHNIRQQQPMKIVVATPVISATAARAIGAEVDDLFFLHIEAHLQPAKEYFRYYPVIDNAKVKSILDSVRKRL